MCGRMFGTSKVHKSRRIGLTSAWKLHDFNALLVSYMINKFGVRVFAKCIFTAWSASGFTHNKFLRYGYKLLSLKFKKYIYLICKTPMHILYAWVMW